MNKLPMGWAWTELGNYIYVKNGYAFKSSDYIEPNENTIPVIRISDIQDNEVSINSTVHINSDDNAQNFLINGGDLLIAMSGATTGKIGIFKENKPAYQNQRVGNIKLINEKLGNLKFRNYLIQSLSKDILKIAHGGAQPNISGKAIEQIEILLPPKAEQDHIATLLDNHLSQVATIRQKLNDILPIIKQFRQSVLAQAVSGKLLADLDFENWQRLTINDVSFKCKQRKPDDTEQFTYIDIASIDKDFKKITNPQILLGKDAPSRARKIVNGGDVIVSLTRPNLNAVALVDLGFDEQIASTGFEVLKPKENILSYFLFLIVQTNHFVNAMVEKTQGALYPAIKSADVQSYEINLPPLPEQQQIVAEVERLFAVADSIETQVNAALARVENLTQSILHQAFIGNLSADWRACNADLITGEHSAAALLDTLKANAPNNKTKKPKKSPLP